MRDGEGGAALLVGNAAVQREAPASVVVDVGRMGWPPRRHAIGSGAGRGQAAAAAAEVATFGDGVARLQLRCLDEQEAGASDQGQQQQRGPPHFYCA